MSIATLIDTTTADAHSISPTDISQFIRLDQCQRYLRLRLHERSHGLGFMRDQGMEPQTMPTSLTRSGEQFEQRIEADIVASHAWIRFSASERTEDNDNDAVVRAARDLARGETLILGQPRLQSQLESWRLVGLVDLIRLERHQDGTLAIMIADMKSSAQSRVEHRLQIAFYEAMFRRILELAQVPHLAIQLAVLYRGPASEPTATMRKEDLERLEAHQVEARRLFGVQHGYLDVIAEPDSYADSARDLVLGEHSQAQRVLHTPFTDIPFHLTSKCDGCLYNEYCMRQASENDDLSLIPHITEGDKAALIRQGVTTVRELATLKDLVEHEPAAGRRRASRLVPASGREAQARTLSTSWPVGGRIDELIHRARRYRKFKGEPIPAAWDIPGSGQASLPFSSPDHNPNLIRIFIDAQQDYLNDRVYLLGALVVGNENGSPHANRRRSIVRLTAEPPTTTEIERTLLVDWVQDTLRAVVELAAPDAEGQPKAPIHLVFVNGIAQKALLDALGRHATEVFGITALYDFVTQLAAFTSPIGTHLESQIRAHKNYPMVCQSLQAVAAYLGFEWNSPVPYRDLFKSRLFDFWGKHTAVTDDSPGISQWYTNRARFNSGIPLEYAMAAWGDLPQLAAENEDPTEYTGITSDLLCGFQARRLEAMEHIANDFRGNDKTELSVFSLPDLATFVDRATSFAHALEEFATIEQHVELADWKNARLADPETRALRGHTLILRYNEDDQLPGIAERNRDNQQRLELDARLIAGIKQANPKANRSKYTDEQKAATKWSQEDMLFRLRIDTSDLPCDLDQLLRLTTIKADGRYILFERHAVDSRRPAAEQEAFNATPKQMLYGMRADLIRLEVERDKDLKAQAAFAVVRLSPSRGGKGNGFVYNTINFRPLVPGEVLTLDADPNNWMGERAVTVSQGLMADRYNRLYDMLKQPDLPGAMARPTAFAQGQAQFLAGIDALIARNAFLPFEVEQRDYIALHGDTPLLLVQGPPGTGKSFSTAFALLARFQGAMKADIPYRVFLSCKTHSATDVLLHNLRDAQQRMAEVARNHPDVFARYFDDRLLKLPLMRFRPSIDHQPRIVPVPQDRYRESGTPRAVDQIEASKWCAVAATPGGVFSLVKDQWPKDIFGHEIAHCLVLDEASQMNLPEAIMAALPLAADGQLIVVGDHRQMPPIVKNDWNNESRRTFQEFRTYESLFVTLLEREAPIIRFARSFRLHADMAEFLRREIYSLDGIDYHSKRHDVIDHHRLGDSFLAAVLNPNHPLTVIVHEEASSQVLNEYELQLISPILATLADTSIYNLMPDTGFGVVVPHRAQRAAFQERSPDLNMLDDHGEVLVSAVDTVERFQGDERTVMLIGATESDRDYLLVSSKFLLDPRRLTVALSRARQKMILVASRSVFEIFSTDEETFANAQLWKNLLRKTCTVPLWEGERHGAQVQVWGNPSSDGSTQDRSW